MNNNVQAQLSERLSATSTLELNKTRKRKRGTPLDSVSKAQNNVGSQNKRQKDVADDLDVSVGINKKISEMNSQLIADYVAQLTRKYEGDLSSIELEDRYISANAIRDTTSWTSLRTIENLPGFLEKFAQNPTKLWSASKKNGAPHTIIVAGAGLRAADLARVIRKFQTKDAVVAKLFAKHIKIKDAITFLRNNRTGIAVGTPTRLHDLLNDGALATDRVERIVVDASYIDQKKRGILEMKETHVPLIKWLNHGAFKERLTSDVNGIDLLFY